MEVAARNAARYRNAADLSDDANKRSLKILQREADVARDRVNTLVKQLEAVG